MKKYTKLFNVRVSEKELNDWKQRADEKNKNLSTHIRELLKEDITKSSIETDKN